jgi:hypothetical protein
MKRLRILVIVSFILQMGWITGYLFFFYSELERLGLVLFILGFVNYFMTVYYSGVMEVGRWKTIVLSVTGIVCVFPPLLFTYLVFVVPIYFILSIELIYRTRKSLS